MARRSGLARGQGARQRQNDNPFAALGRLRARLKSSPVALKPPSAPIKPEIAEINNHDRALFLRAIEGTLPLASKGQIEIAPPPPPVPRQHRMDETAALDESLAARPTVEDRLDNGEEAAFLRSGLRRRVLIDLRRGRWTPQGKIDLHGLKREEAREALSLFIAAALVQGKRCVRVIHGQGHGSPGKVPVLKQLARDWLARREEILAFCQAPSHEGGAGALLVLLRAP
ncbi:MAG: Smr/MutS family protein [Azoarcus sp.]|jgi:DNA-nicking Smr family endonuclease|nr:Smr/MutS family protein [Azoarcus sp.]